MEAGTAAVRPGDQALRAPQVQAAIAQLRSRLVDGTRTVLGITGAPGSGKSTFASLLEELLGADVAVVVPMDGFHLSNAVIDGGPLRDRKGAIETFDVGGYASLLQRLAQPIEPVVYAPDFNRSLDEPIAASIAVPADLPLVITEGNYLLADGHGWQGIREHLDEVWYLESPEALRRRRLTERHVLFGKERVDAEKWAHGTDQFNAELVHATRHKADRIIPWS